MFLIQCRTMDAIHATQTSAARFRRRSKHSGIWLERRAEPDPALQRDTLQVIQLVRRRRLPDEISAVRPHNQIPISLIRLRVYTKVSISLAFFPNECFVVQIESSPSRRRTASTLTLRTIIRRRDERAVSRDFKPFSSSSCTFSLSVSTFFISSFH